MPIYEYKCPECGAEVEELQRYEDPPPACPSDPDHGKMKRQVSETTFKLEGRGWAADGYAG
jgi:putative FmdB family regulatory protein